MSIYILKLENDKYYVCKNSKSNLVLEDISSSINCGWVKLYKPKEIVETINITNNTDFEEDKHTLKYMKTYGIDNVRGGSFIDEDLDRNVYHVIETLINTQTEKNAFESYEKYSVEEIQTEINRLDKLRKKIFEINQFINTYQLELTPENLVFGSACGKYFINDASNKASTINDPKFNFSPHATPTEKALKINIVVKEHKKELEKLMKTVDDNCKDVKSTIEIINKKIEILYKVYSSKL